MKYPKKVLAVFLAVLTVVSLAGCVKNLTNKEDIIKLYEKYSSEIAEAVKGSESGEYDFSKLQKKLGIESIYKSDEYGYIEFSCGGSGMGPSTHYYGFYYSASDDIGAVFGSENEFVPEGNGYAYNQPDGDNRFYVENIGEHFYYYEAHF